MNIVIGPYEAFYIVGAIMLLVIAIIVYPTLSEQERSRRK